jgi:hypothetical protein
VSWWKGERNGLLVFDESGLRCLQGTPNYGFFEDYTVILFTELVAERPHCPQLRKESIKSISWPVHRKI